MRWVGLTGLLGALLTIDVAGVQAQPNVVVIMADDLGWADTSPYGSEIPTPAIAQLALNGLQYTDFRATPLCPCTRGTLLTGQYPHTVGCGSLGDFGPQYPGYRGRASTLFATLPGLLAANGYETFVSGKRQIVGTPQDYRSGKYGFTQTYSCAIEGGDVYYWPPLGRPRTVEKNGVAQTTFPSTWFSSDEIEREALGFLRGRNTSKPFYLYLPIQDPHYPLQSRPAEIAVFAGNYAQGWEATRTARFAAQQQLGLFATTLPLPPPDTSTIPWATLTAAQRADAQLRMACFAAQVTRADRAVAVILAELTAQNVLSNTLIVFLSDNGATNEWSALGTTWRLGAGVGTATFSGTYGGNWGAVSNTPFRGFKRSVLEGGLRVPCIIRYDAGIPVSERGTRRTLHANCIDVVPTVLDVCGIVSTPLPGSSVVDSFTSTTSLLNRPQFFEFQGEKCVLWLGWKLRQSRVGAIRLYFTPIDPGETNNLFGQSPAFDWIAIALAQLWLSWASANNVSLVWPLP